MAQKIKFNIIQSLFQLFSFLADKTGGWAMFVKPKILLGSVILGLSACSSNTKQNTSEQTDTVKVKIEESDCIDVNYEDTMRRITICYYIAPKIVEKKKESEIKKTEEPEIETIGDMVVCYGMVDIEEFPEVFSIEEKDINYVDTIIYQVSEVEQKPEFPGGMEALYKFIGKNLRLPTIMCYDGGIQGRVTCSFIVEKSGRISNVEVVKSLDPAGDKEAVRVIESMPNWIPGKQNGIPVRVKYTIPINFKIQ